jgi:hypothetical protein
VQVALRTAFYRWGRPQRLRVDNGTPWGSIGDWPTELALWLIGSGIGMIWNPPRSPQDNGVIERSQGTGKNWAEPQTCHDPAELQGRLDRMDRVQREAYPSVRGRSRCQAFPELRHSGRLYNKAWEDREWDLESVLAHMADYRVVRRVDSKGQVSLYNRNHYVGKHHRGVDIYVLLDPLACEWVFTGTDGTQLRRKAAEELNRERICNLNVLHRHNRKNAGGKTQCRD